MWIVGAVAGLGLLLLLLIDGFETVVQPRRVTHAYRFARLYYRSGWMVWRAVARGLASGRTRESFLSVFGPLSLLGLFATWVLGLIVAFALLHWSAGSVVRGAPGAGADMGTYLYMSGTTFFTLGYGDVTPAGSLGRGLAVVESGLGFGFLAGVISYLPAMSQAFSRREVTISLLDARAGSPPAAAELLARMGRAGNVAAVGGFLAEWERWSAELLESHMSFPVLGYYRSQHDNESWLAALTSMMDTCAVLLAAVENAPSYQARLTFAMARHAAVDLALLFKVPPLAPEHDRLPGERLTRMREALRQAGLTVRDGGEADAKLAELRGLYEPFVNALGRHFMFALPQIWPENPVADNWQRSAWTTRAPGIGGLGAKLDEADRHFE